MSSPTTEEAALWGGGFEEPMHPALAQISDSMHQDAPLADADLQCSAVYAQALARCGVLKKDEGEQLAQTLHAMRDEMHQGDWYPETGEDVHTAIEHEVTKRLGDLGARLHTGRSRNDQVSTAFRFALGEWVDGIIKSIRQLQTALIARAEAEMDTLLPSYTHFQRAQPIRLSHWLMGYFWPLERDVQRLQSARSRIMLCPLGCGAVSGHPFGIDREWMAQQLGFVGVTQNSIDTVGDRDFAAEFAFTCSMVALHLSRLSEELVLWSTTEFGFIQWPDSLASGSSLMPNKKNPDLAELVRGRSASTVGDLMSLLMLIKGLPQSYQRDLQEDKPPVWRIAQTTDFSLAAMVAAIGGITFDRARMTAALSDDLLATEAADVLVTRGIPFRQAHSIVAKVSAEARRAGVGFKVLASQATWQPPEPLTREDLQNLQPLAAIERRTTIGGTARKAVEQQIAQAKLAVSMPAGKK